MACGKPPDPDSISDATPLQQPIGAPARLCMRDVQVALTGGAPGPELDRNLDRARKALARAEAAGLTGHQLDVLRQQFDQLTRMAENKLRELVRGPASTYAPAPPPPLNAEMLNNTSVVALERIAKTIRAALTDRDHWRHGETTDQMIRIVMGNEAIGLEYKNQLFKDIAEVISATPDALGLVKEATLRGQRNAVASPGKLGTGLGYAYEIMGTAQLIRDTSIAANTKLPLHVDVLRDRVDHGIKFQASYMDTERKLFQSRKEIEADILIYKPATLFTSAREVAVDFKHANGAGGFSDKGGKANTRAGKSDLATQLTGVVNALKTGEIHEFHFATNGHFSEGFKEAVERANQTLPNDCSLISVHEHVIATGLQ